MNKLILTVRFLDGRFHGRGDGGRPEWPPSPLRLYQALLAGAKVNWNGEREAAFRWLEQQAAPTIHSPKHAPGSVRLTYVPNNNSDTIRDPGKLRTGKMIEPTLLPQGTAVRYVWHVPPTGESHARVIADAARHLRALGWGIDLAIGHGEVCNGNGNGHLASPATYYPASENGSGGRVLRSPAPGTLASLEQRYLASLQRVTPDGTLRDDPGGLCFEQTVYRTTPGRRHVGFALQDDDGDRPGVVRPRRIKQLVGMLRKLAASDAVTTALGGDVVEHIIQGHPVTRDGPRLSILPLPSIGHAHSDGLIRRVILAESQDVDGTICRQLGKLLHGQRLVPKHADDDMHLRLVRIDNRADGVVDAYTTSSRSWCSVTPVLLPGYDDRKLHRGNHRKRLDRARQLIVKALGHAQFPMASRITITKTPMMPGSLYVRDYVVREKLQHYPRWHVRLDFEDEITGPLSIGAGRHVGFGIMADAT